MMLFLMFYGGDVRTTLNLDDELLAQAQRLSGLTERTQLVREALLALVQRESAKRLAQLDRSFTSKRLSTLSIKGH